MDPLPASVVAAISCSAAAGKNPWIPLGLLFVLAAPESVPSFLMEPELHRALHELGPPGLLWGLGGGFLVLAALESLADKLPWVEQWLVPVSTAWRPFASVAVATIIGVAVANAPTDVELAVTAPDLVRAETGWWMAGSVLVLTILAGAVYGWLSTIGKVGTRLLLSLVPLPSLRLLHSFLDDFFALAATFAGLAFGDSVLVLIAVVVYLLVGLFTGPLLARLAWIHFRIGIATARKAWRHLKELPPEPPRPPAWLGRAVEAQGADPTSATALPCYTYKAPEVGRCRAGWLVFTAGAVFFVTRVRFRTRALRFDDATLARLGLADTATDRAVALSLRTDNGGLLEVLLHLFPSAEAEVLPLLERGAEHAGLVRVRAHSESARRGLPGFAQAGSSTRYLPANQAGSLRTQAVLTLVAAVAFGVLSGGLFIPIGLGYAISPYPRRFALGLGISAYLSLCVLGSLGFGWPVAVIYAVLLNTVALRDLTRSAVKARVDGFVDKRAFLPAVSGRVWVPAAGTADADRWQEGDGLPVTDGPWRAIVALLAEPIDTWRTPEPA
jgi:hypothetical protein